MIAFAVALSTVARGQTPPAATLSPDLVGRRVDEVRVVGNGQVPSAVILRSVATRVGDRFDPQMVEADYQRVYALKRFSNVGARVEPDAGGGVAVVFTVSEQKLIKSVKFAGNRVISTDDLQKDVDVKAGEAVEPFRINLAKRAIASAYRAKNHPTAHADVDEAALARTGELVFNVTEGPPVTIRNIEFVGRKSFTYDRLKDQIGTTRWYWIFNAGNYDEQEAAADVGKLRRYYRDHGFFDCRVGHKLIVSPDQTEVQVDFLIDEGPRYTVDKVIFNGNKAVTESTLRKDLKLTEGQSFDAELLSLDVKKLVRDYSPLGYIYESRGAGPDDLRIGRPGQEYPARIVPHMEPGSVDLVYDISEGTPQTVGRTFVVGNANTQERLALRELRFASGQLWDSGEVEDAIDRLKGRPYYGNVSITPIPPAGGEPNTRDVLVEVTERPSTNITAGAGVNSSTGLAGNFGYTQTNFDVANPSLSLDDLRSGHAWTGAGQTFRVDFQPGTTVTSGSVLFSEPYILDLPYSLTTEGYYRRLYREGWSEQHAGGSLTLGKQFDYVYSAAVTAQAEELRVGDVEDYFPLSDKVNVLDPVTRQPRLRPNGTPQRQLRTIRAPDVIQYAGQNFVTNLGLTVRRDTTNHGVLTYQGNSVKLTYLLFGALGGVTHFHQFDVGVDQYVTLGRDLLDRRTVLALHAGANYNTPDAPFFERFYGGGGFDGVNIRGFQYRGVGPRAGRARDPVGGNFGVSGTVELNFPIYGDGIRGVVFNDVGTVEPDIGIHTIRDSVGVGVRVVLPFLGPTPLAFDVAFPVKKAPQDIEQIFSFGIRTNN